MGLREDERDLKQVSHKKPFKKLFQDVLRLDESRGSVAKIFTTEPGNSPSHETPKISFL